MKEQRKRVGKFDKIFQVEKRQESDFNNYFKYVY